MYHGCYQKVYRYHNKVVALLNGISYQWYPVCAKLRHLFLRPLPGKSAYMVAQELLDLYYAVGPPAIIKEASFAV